MAVGPAAVLEAAPGLASDGGEDAASRSAAISRRLVRSRRRPAGRAPSSAGRCLRKPEPNPRFEAWAAYDDIKVEASRRANLGDVLSKDPAQTRDPAKLGAENTVGHIPRRRFGGLIRARRCGLSAALP
jgi:hypothetical protein